ncbi:Uncharacterized protein FWK35_00017141 [Aphis craccivora]|uniref:Uncharacterized protein n=1 Tax=Aphis craccivora TaxID=307492 RepID=A0A6G0YPU0_APHCR|nr:Uncharacterized protein FWK35_00017141 [Aphis craccivora]
MNMSFNNNSFYHFIMLKIKVLNFNLYTSLNVFSKISGNIVDIYTMKFISKILNEVMNVLILQWCVFFLCLCTVYSITSRNNALISNFGGGFRCKSEYPWSIIEVKNH